MNPFASLAGPIAREEEMDAAELPPARYAKVLADLSRINALTLAPRHLPPLPQQPGPAPRFPEDPPAAQGTRRHQLMAAGGQETENEPRENFNETDVACVRIFS